MSRLIIKNLPKNITEEKLKERFSESGVITDLKLCYTKSGVFRKFAFVGYQTEVEGKSALKHFHKTFLDTSKISVEIAKNLGDNEAPRPWSKYSKGSSAHETWSKTKAQRLKLVEELQDETNSKKKSDKKGKKSTANIDTHEDGDDFKEFLEAHQVKSKKKLWANEAMNDELTTKANKKADKSATSKQEKLIYDDDDDDSDDDDEKEDDVTIPMPTEEAEPNSSLENKSDNEDSQIKKKSKKEKKKAEKAVSDFDWLKSKVVKTQAESSPSHGSLTVDKENQDDNSDDDNNDDSESSEDDDMEETNTVKENRASEVVLEAPGLTVKMRGLPFKCKEKEIIEFFKPLKIVDIRLPLNEDNKPTGNAYVDFDNIEEAGKAMKYNHDYMKGRYIELFPMATANFDDEMSKDKRSWESKAENSGPDEPISESGRLFLRNLSYLCTEDALEHLFTSYGPLSETSLPLDKKTNQPTGIAFVTFMMPEHAVKAFNKLDGTVFQGRMLHILPGKSKDPNAGNYKVVDAKSSYKREKDKAQKSLSTSDHNWNTLFLGSNAVADVMADRLNTTKSGILDTESSQSLAVRLALGETQVVSETKDFLESQGVRLDVFGQASAKRSKTVIIAKNLPHGTSAIELRDVFAKFGDLGRVVIPPAGITGIIEFLNPQDSKQAFQNLAYSKFKHVPLYLEWAPLDLLEENTTPVVEKKEEDVNKDKDEKDTEMAESNGDDDEDDDESGNVLFIKNINFESKEETLKEVFVQCGKVRSLTIAKKKDPRNASSLLSMGYGFVEYKKKAHAQEALKTLQHTKVDGHQLELKVSQRQTLRSTSERKKAEVKKQTTSKILVRNVPFEANRKELMELFSTFGEIKTLRLPKKVTGTGPHRGFAFVDFLTKQDAKRAFKALCQSTHLYGRRLVLEWADNDDSVDALRIRTAKHFHAGGPASKKSNNEFLEELEKTDAAK